MSGRIQSSARIEEASAILNTLVLDLMVGVRSIDIFRTLNGKQSLSQNMRVGLNRLSTVHLLLALAKWMEFYKYYKDLIPEDLAPAAKANYKKLQSRGVREFRNKVVGHIWDDKLKRPLSTAEVHTRLSDIIGPNEDSFNRLIYDPDAASRTDHLVGLTEEIRDALDL